MEAGAEKIPYVRVSETVDISMCLWLLWVIIDNAVVVCGSLDSPENGLLAISNITFGSIANYSCDEGYNIMGNEMRLCLESGLWSGEDPICQSEYA